MNYEIVKSFNDRTKLGMSNGDVFVLKEISLDDTDMYKQLVKLDNENVVRFVETTVVDDKFYAVEEFIHGTTLKNYVEAHGCLDDEETKQLILQVCNGLSAIHNLKIVHRDINPNNIMITNDGVIKIIDFGISRTIKSNQNCDTQILGTQGYTAPEQFGFHQTSEKSDIYSVGVLINYMKTMKIPSETLTTGMFSEIVLKCTQIDENNRYNNISDLATRIAKKNKVNHIVKTIPGFRKGIWWHKIIASLYYIAFVILLVAFIETSKSIRDLICSVGYYVFTFAVPVPILTNYLNWVNKSMLTKNKTKVERKVIQIVLVGLSFLIAFLFIIADS